MKMNLTLEPVKMEPAPANTINFMDNTSPIPILQFGPNYEIRIRGELVDCNKTVYEAMVDYLNLHTVVKNETRE